MSKKDKLIKRLKSDPRDFSFDELQNLLELLGFEMSNKGKTSGSRVKFSKGNTVITAADVPRLLGGGAHLSVQWGILSPTEPRNCFTIPAAC